MSELSLSGFVNVGKLEDVLQTLIAKLDTQQSRIELLERQAACSVSLDTFQTLSHRLESTIIHMNTQFAVIDKRLGEMQEEMGEMQTAIKTLPDLRVTVDNKIDTAEYTRRTDDVKTQLMEQIISLKNEKASKSIVSSLESSQHRLVEEILAIQKLVSCKIDRVEVPLLDVASEKLQFLLDFQATADGRLEKNEMEIASIFKNLDKKENKDSNAKSLFSLREELAKKVDVSFLKEHVVNGMEKALDDIAKLKASEEALEKLMENYHTHLEKFARLEKSSVDLRSDSSRLQQQYEQLLTEVGHKADFKAIDSIVFENADEIEKIIRTYETKTSHETKIQSALVADLRTQFSEMQSYQNVLDGKLQTALRFIDWFLDVKKGGGQF